MYELDASEVEQVSGGAVAGLTVLAVAGFVYYERENIRDFFEGVFQGIEQNQAQH